MDISKIIKKAFFLLILCAAVVGCAGPEFKRPEEPYIVWPPPPEPPRIQYITTYSSSTDVGEAPGFFDAITGLDIYTLEAPQGIAVDREGNIYVSDSTRGVIAVFEPSKKKFRLMGDREPEKSKVPLGLAVDNTRHLLFVASSGTQKVVGYDLTTGAPKVVIAGFSRPVGVAVDEARGRIYVTDAKVSELKAFDSSGNFISKIATRGDLFVPGQVATDRQGNIYVADTFNFKIKIFGPDGKFIKAIGKGLGDKMGYFSKVTGVAVDSEGHIYTLDTDFSKIQIFDREGNVLLIVGWAGSLKGAFTLPFHLYIDANDRIYVADTFNSRVQVFQYLKEGAK